MEELFTKPLKINEARINLTRLGDGWPAAHPVESLRLRRTGTQRYRHLNDHGRAVVLISVCAVALVAAPTPRRLPAGTVVSTRLRSRTQPPCVPDRILRNR